jgi:hypothetical protein
VWNESRFKITGNDKRSLDREPQLSLEREEFARKLCPQLGWLYNGLKIIAQNVYPQLPVVEGKDCEGIVRRHRRDDTCGTECNQVIRGDVGLVDLFATGLKDPMFQPHRQRWPDLIERALRHSALRVKRLSSLCVSGLTG